MGVAASFEVLLLRHFLEDALSSFCGVRVLLIEVP